MLVLGRKPSETIYISGAATIVVVEIRSLLRVNLGIKAPPEVRISRGTSPYQLAGEETLIEHSIALAALDVLGDVNLGKAGQAALDVLRRYVA